MKEWEKQYEITTISLLKPPQGEIPRWRKEGKLAVPPNLTIKHEIMRVVHEGLITGHPGRDETIAQTQRNYWWPDLQAWIMEYVQGCAICQQNKIITHRVMEITPMMTGKSLPCIVMTGHSLFLIVCCVLLLVKAA